LCQPGAEQKFCSVFAQAAWLKLFSLGRSNARTHEGRSSLRFLMKALPQLTPPKLPSSIFKCDIGAQRR
jgi:hypothetical protein